MEIEALTRRQTKRIYREHLKKDFPDSERRPLPSILKAMRRGIYDCYGLRAEGEIVAYAFFVHIGADYLLDYFAVAEGKRTKGYGSVFLGMLKEQMTDARYVLAEVEEPETAENAAEKETRIRRIRFYERAGFADTGARANTFGVEYRIIGLQTGRPFDREQICALYVPFYSRLMPEFICRREVKPYLKTADSRGEMPVDGKAE